VLHGKGDRRRVVGVDVGTLELLERWLLMRRKLVPRGGPVFCTYSGPRRARGEPLAPAYVRAMLKRHAARAGIAKRVHPHGFRHTHAVELAGEGVPVHVIRAQLGHADLRTTQRYIDHLAPGELVATMRRREWD
jgi:site-specific recombinase XerD